MSDNFSLADQVARLPAADREAFYSELTESDAKALDYDWGFWGRPNQFEPTNIEWTTWLILAGRGFGKTRAGAEWVRAQMCGSTPLSAGRVRHMALVAETAADARKVMLGDGLATGEGSGIMQVHSNDFRPTYNPSLKRVTWPNGSIASLYNATEPEELRGPQHGAAWCDELCKWRYFRDTYDNLSFGLRLGDRPRIIITTTPKPIPLLKEILKDPLTVTTRGSTLDNRANLPDRFIAAIMKKYSNSRLGQQEIYAQVLEDFEGALWKRATIEQYRVSECDLPTLKRIIVAVDPAVSSNEHSNETGIVVVGLGEDDRGYVLDDMSGIYTPDEWARIAVKLYWERRADRIVAEVNQGGAMVESTIRMVDPNVSYRAVFASKGKFIRAEPISALYDQGRVSHCGMFAELEEQMANFCVDFDRDAGGSPDRVDALVWGLTEILVDAQESRLYFG